MCFIFRLDKGVNYCGYYGINDDIQGVIVNFYQVVYWVKNVFECGECEGDYYLCVDIRRVFRVGGNLCV